MLHLFSGVNPWMVSCWACQFIHLPQRSAHKDAFQQADTRLWKLSRQMKARHTDVEANMESLATEFVNKKKVYGLSGDKRVYGVFAKTHIELSGGVTL